LFAASVAESGVATLTILLEFIFSPPEMLATHPNVWGSAGVPLGFRPQTAVAPLYKPGGSAPQRRDTVRVRRQYQPTVKIDGGLGCECAIWVSFFASISNNARGSRNLRKKHIKI